MQFHCHCHNFDSQYFRTILKQNIINNFLFMNKDGTLDGSRLFNNAQQFFPKITFGAVKIFATKNNTKVLAHAGSTVVLPCTVAEESKFEMVSMFLHQRTLIHFFFQSVVFLSKRLKLINIITKFCKLLKGSYFRKY